MAVAPFSSDRRRGLPNRKAPVRPSLDPERIPVPARRAIVGFGVYVDGRRVPDQHDYKTALDYVRSRGKGFVWIGVFEPNRQQMDDIAAHYGIHELIVEDAALGMQRPKLESYDSALVLNMRTVDYQAHASVQDTKEIVETGDILIITGHDYVITVRHGNFGGLTGLRHQMESRPEFLALGPSAVTHAVADHVVDAYMSVTEAVESDVEELESDVFNPNEELEIDHIYLLKREVLELKHTVIPLALPLRRLAMDHYSPICSDIRHYFRDVYDHQTVVSEAVTAYDERLTSLVSAAIARSGNQQNQDMRRISAWVAIVAVPTMIAGIYGMNFNYMPELELKFGYFGALGLMVLVAVVLFVLFRRNKWL